MKLMKSSTQIDSLVFQLTPTRTRCDLVIAANGKSEKIASGLLNPFLAHLKAAEEQIGKGGYSIVLEPKPGSDASWFTKGTVERFVRFVSSPEILERVYTVESEIIQIEKSISLQNSNDNGLHNVEDFPAKSEERLEGSKNSPACNEEKAIVLYQPTSHQSEDDTSTTQEKNSKVQLVKVFEARKSVLQKEQGMAFARAVAASFDADNIAALLIFAECFGASRMKDACKKYSDLWKAKHDNGQWVEVEAAEAMACGSDMPSTNAAGIVFLSPNEQGDIAAEKRGTPVATTTDQAQPNAQEYSPGQYPHHMFPPWQMHPQASGAPVFPPYAMQGMPYYQNYMGQSPFFQPPYSPHDDPRLHSGRKTRRQRHSMDSRDMNSEGTQDTDTSPRRKHDEVTDDEEESMSRKPKNRGGRSKKQPGTVVVRNINYYTSAKQGSSESDPHSCSNSGTCDEKVDKTKKLKKKGDYLNFDDPVANAKEKRISGPTGDDGHWQAFQNFLLKDADENNNSSKSSMLATEGKVQGRKRQSAIRDDASALGMDKSGEYHVGGNLEIAEDGTCVRKPMDDQMLIHGQDHNMKYNGKKDMQFMEAEGRRGAYRRPVDPSMEHVINRQDRLTDVWDPSLDPVMRNGYQRTSDTNNKGSSSHGMSDESFLVLQKSGSSEVTGDGRKIMDMDCELPVALNKAEDHNVGPRSQTHYEPNDLNLMPNRAMENLPSGYDPAIYCEMQAQIKDTAKVSSKKDVAVDAKGGPRKSAKDHKLKAEKRSTVGARREKPSKFSPAEDAQARAEKLRAYKADLQKLKKEKEEEQLKRIEALKLERQKRIAAKSGVNPAQTSLPSQQAKRQMPKLSPVSQKSSKFSDTEPGSCSPLQRSKLRIISKVSPDSSKATKSVNRLTRSASTTLRSQKEDKIGATPDSKATMSRIRRLSEPKGVISLEKVSTSEVVSRHRMSERPEMKKMPAAATVDKAESSSIPEVKARVSKASAATSQRKSTKEMSQKPNDKTLAKGLVHSEVRESRDSANKSSTKDVDDNTIVEKTVVMLECEKPSAPVFHAPEENLGIQTTQPHAYNQASKPEEDATIPPPASPITVKEVDREASNCVTGKSHTGLDEAAKVSPNLPYQAPYARVSSLEDPCMAESNYGKAPPAIVDMGATGVQTTKVHVADTQRSGLVKIAEADEGKNQSKESPKGLKRLLFGKKSSASSERNAESDKVTTYAATAVDNVSNGSSGEVFTVKNLLNHEESSGTGTAPKKSSRPFSLLSHFRSKTSEKKLTS